MHQSNTQIKPARIALGLVLGLAIATPVVAGTVYSWQTEDGTLSFTDESKKVPKKYKDQAERSSTGDLRSYERYTPADASTDERPYAERLQKRLAQVRGAAAAEAAATAASGAGAPAGAPIAISTGGSRFGRNATMVPVGGAPSGEPVVIEQKRVRPDDSNATRTITVVKQGDRVISVQKGQKNHRSYTGTTATGQPEDEAY